DGVYEENASRWSCLNANAAGSMCSITYDFMDPVDLNSILISFYLGDERVRSLDVYINGESVGIFTSSGTTAGLEEYIVNEASVSSVQLVANDLGTGWISIKETMFYVS
ncbi:unnamed protein product, partial [Choristocarpus tenellus]